MASQIMLIALYAHNNKFSGEKPSALGSCSSLSVLKFERQSFPWRVLLKVLKSLIFLVTTFRALFRHIFKIPLDISRFVVQSLEGEVPVQGASASTDTIYLDGNPQLCGGLLGLHFPRCIGKEVTKAKFQAQADCILCLCTNWCGHCVFGLLRLS